MKNLKVRAALFAAGLMLLGSLGYAQRGGGDWQTSGYDAQRSGWVRGDGKISAETMSKPGFKLWWKLKVANQARNGNSLTPPMLLDFFIGHRGFRTLAFLGGSGDYAMGIDTDLGKMEWEQKLAKSAVAAGPSLACPGGMTSAVARPVQLGYPGTFMGRGAGRGTPAKSAVGEPLEGAAGLKELTSRRPQQFGPPPSAPKPSAAKPRTSEPPSPFSARTQWVHVLTSDGKLHSVYVSNGDEPAPAIDFLPAGAHARGLLVSDRVAYVATVNGCGGVPDGIWALDLESKKVSSWKATGGIAGTLGFAMNPEGNIFVASGQDLVVLEAGTLAVKSSSKAPAAFTSSPVLFDHKGTDMVAVTTADGQLHVFNGAKGGAPVASVAAGAAAYAVGSVASWTDATNARMILVPGAGGVESFEFDGAALRSKWKSRAMTAAATPLIINGVVFALSTGEFRAGKTAAERAAKSQKAVLYALDGLSGKEMWNSGAAITSYVSSGVMSAGGGRIYVSGVDGTQYCFGFHLEI